MFLSAMYHSENAWLASLKNGLQEIVSGNLSLQMIDSKYNVSCHTFKQYLQYYNLKKLSEEQYIEKIETGAPPYLCAQSLDVLSLFGHALDSLDYQLTFETWRKRFMS